MSQVLSSKKILLLFLGVALTLIAGRYIKGHSDFSYFIVAGTDFVDTAHTKTPIITQPGQGYDGQFFYRYALAPGNLNTDAYGVTVDHPAYRVQRIAYPLLAWLASLGGTPAFVPFALVLINLLAFAGISLFTNKFISHVGGSVIQGIYPLFLCGIYMSVARDLSEVTELFFFTGAMYYLFTTRYVLLSLFVALTILTRETSMIAFLPLLGCVFLQVTRKEAKAVGLLYCSIPFAIYAIWKAIIYISIPSISDAAAGYVSFGIPFKGIIMGLKENFDFTDTKHILQFAFWLMYLCWQVAFTLMVFRKVSFKKLLQPGNTAVLKIIYLTWTLFAICFTDNIYGDDWGFVRVFSLWNMTGFLIIIADKKQTGKLFNTCSVIIAILTIARLITRV